jgi:hypothetical protein
MVGIGLANIVADMHFLERVCIVFLKSLSVVWYLSPPLSACTYTKVIASVTTQGCSEQTGTTRRGFSEESSEVEEYLTEDGVSYPSRELTWPVRSEGG